ncbi:hypothetical protein CLJ1_6180 [Pseudomonas paraeruginosa]|nr:hypothetical protein CLJ1_6180 [Pseudomonas aeruginosa]
MLVAIDQLGGRRGLWKGARAFSRGKLRILLRRLPDGSLQLAHGGNR